MREALNNIKDSEPMGAALGASRKRVDRRPGAKRGSAEWRARVARGQVLRWELERRKASAVPEWWRLLRLGVASESMAPHIRAAIEHALEIEADLGDSLSAQRRALLRNATRLEAVISAIAAELAVSPTLDPELCSRLGTLVGVHRAQLQALGLDRLERDALDLATYLQQRRAASATSASATNGPDPVPEVVLAEIDASEGANR